MVEFVLDASAVLALLQQEPGSERIASVLLGADCRIGAVNQAEVLSKLLDGGLNDADATAALALLDLPVIPFDATQAHRVAALRGPTRARGLSLGDRACLALAAELNAVALTMDRAWTTLGLDIGIECARPEPV